VSTSDIIEEEDSVEVLTGSSVAHAAINKRMLRMRNKE
jgi:hypothetical protein